MKKIFALLLAIVMVMGLATVASATTTSALTADKIKVDDAAADISFNFVKKYETTAGAVPATYPTEILEFDVTSSTVTGAPTVTMADHSVESNPDNIVLTVGKAEVPGQYEYTIKEVAGSTQGVSYNTTTELKVTVLVYWDEVTDAQGVTTRTLKKQVTVTQPASGEKVDTIVNKYDLGTLTVNKTVTGNLASVDAVFDINVTFKTEKDQKVESVISYEGGSLTGALTIGEAEWSEPDANGIRSVTKTIQVKHGGTVTFTNIPEGVTYEVVEQAKHLKGANDAVDPNSPITEDYTVSYTDASDSIEADKTAAAKVVNEKSTSVSTGIVMDSVPFVVMAVIAVLGLAAFTAKKRVQE